MADYHFVTVSVTRTRTVAVDKRVARSTDEAIRRAKRRLISDVEYYRFDTEDVSARLETDGDVESADDVIAPE